MSNCVWCEKKGIITERTQIRMLQKICDSCANEYDEHDQRWGH